MSRIQSILRSRVLWSSILIVTSLVSVYGLGLGMRRSVLESQVAQIGDDMPFTLESALHYRRIKILHDRGELPAIDQAIQYPEGIHIARIDGIAGEPLYAKLARLFPDDMPFASRLRWIESAWFCLGIPLLALLVRAWTRSWFAGLISAALYAVAISSVLRTTGQEISRENFALPWLIAAGAAAGRYFRSPERERGDGLWATVAAILLALSLATWDMIQYVIAILAFGMSLHLLIRGRGYDPKTTRFFAAVAVATWLTGLIHPYYRFHGFPTSPLSAWMLSPFIGMAWLAYASPDESGSAWRARWKLGVVLLLPPLAVAGLGMFGTFGDSYGHFADLLVAKIRFLNVKPTDPGLMNFDQRIMWVPSLHSATWALTKWLFPYTVWIGCVVAVYAFVHTLKRPDSLLSFWLLLFVSSIAAYVLFVRFHVFVILAACVLCGWLLGRIPSKALAWRTGLAALLILGVVTEGMHTYQQREVMGRPNVYYEELDALADWLVEHVSPDPVLANMGVSAYVAAYGKCAVVMHPKFEEPTIRKRLETYGELLFGADEKALRDWMDTLGVEYLVYAKGEFSKEKPEYQMRYFVNKMEPPDTVPARRFERDDESMRYFRRLWGNHKYVVYRTLCGADESRSAGLAEQAMAFLQDGRIDEAERMAVRALDVNPAQEDALKVMRHVGSLRDQGFRYAGEKGAP